jgi:hypothetical protein
MDDQPKKRNADPAAAAGEDAPETPRRRAGFRRFLDWLIRGAERSRKDPGRCPT